MNDKIKFTLYRERPATQADVDDMKQWLDKHDPERKNYKDLALGEEMDAEDECELPARYEVCDRCRGHGQICNPSIGAITSSEWHEDWDPEEQEAYLEGRYDVICPECKGRNVVLVVDEEACKNEPLKSLMEAYFKQIEDRARMDAEDRYTRYMESGGRDY